MIKDALETIREHGGLYRLENTDAWFIAHRRPPKSLPEAWDAEEIDTAEAQALVRAGLVKPRLQYSLDGGTLILVYAIAQEPRETNSSSSTK